ncbi:hypothetical protein ACSBR2_017834 [Camellia fascicularis]
MVAESKIDANHFTLKSCVETVTAISNLSHRLQNRTSEVHQLNASLSQLQSIYNDDRAEISALKKQNKKLKRHATSPAQFGGLSYSAFNSRQGVILLGVLPMPRQSLQRLPESDAVARQSSVESSDKATCK